MRPAGVPELRFLLRQNPGRGMMNLSNLVTNTVREDEERLNAGVTKEQSARMTRLQDNKDVSTTSFQRP